MAVRVLPGPLREQPLAQLLSLGVQLNVLLAIFNLVPLPPLDGSHVVSGRCPNGMGAPLHGDDRPVRRASILLALVMSGALLHGPAPRCSTSSIGLLYSLVR